MSLPCLVNGQPQASVAIADRGFQYGDGLFETLTVVDGEPLAWLRHVQRLQTGCERLAIPAPPESLLRAEAQSVCRGAARAVLKVVVTRGEGGRGYRYEAGAPTRVVSLWPWPAHPRGQREAGVAVRLCETRLSAQPRLAGIKHLNRLEQVLARAEWRDEFAEGLVRDGQGRLIGGTMSNLFLVTSGTLRTPELAQSGVAGVIRGAAIERARERGLTCREEDLVPEDVLKADEAFLTNSVIGVWPIATYQQRRFPVGDITRALIQDLVEKRLIAVD